MRTLFVKKIRLIKLVEFWAKGDLLHLKLKNLRGLIAHHQVQQKKKRFLDQFFYLQWIYKLFVAMVAKTKTIFWPFWHIL